MRKLIVNTFLSLDGVMQAPGGPSAVGSASSKTASSPPASGSSTARPPPRASSWPPTSLVAPSPPDPSRWSSRPDETSKWMADEPQPHALRRRRLLPRGARLMPDQRGSSCT